MNLTWFNSKERIAKLTEGLGKKDKRIGFAHVVDVTRFDNKESTKFGDFPVGSALSHQLLPIDHNFKVLTNLNKNISTNLKQLQQMHYKVPCETFPLDYKLIPKDWDNIKEQENTFLETLKLSEETAYTLEQETVTHSSCSAWYELRNRLTSSKAHLAYKQQRNRESLAKSTES